MTATTVAAFASLGPYKLHAPSTSDILLLCGAASPASLDHYRFRFIDGQEFKPGAHGIVRMTFPDGQLPPSAGPLPIWAGSIIGQIWGLHLVYCALPEITRLTTRVERVEAGPRAERVALAQRHPEASPVSSANPLARRVQRQWAR